MILLHYLFIKVLFPQCINCRHSAPLIYSDLVVPAVFLHRCFVCWFNNPFNQVRTYTLSTSMILLFLSQKVFVMNACANCNQPTSKNQTRIQCDCCKQYLHVSCTRNKARALKAVCNVCNSKFEQLADIKGLIESLKADINSKISRLEQKLRANWKRGLR